MSYTRSLYHLVFRTYDSKPALALEHSEKLYRYIWGFCREKECALIRVNGMEDHLHLLVRLHPDIALSAFVRDLKTASSKWIKQHRDAFPDFCAWGKGYAAFSYSHNEQEAIKNYIAGQREHHRTKTFDEEFREFLTENNIAFDEKYFLRE